MALRTRRFVRLDCEVVKRLIRRADSFGASQAAGQRLAELVKALGTLAEGGPPDEAVQAPSITAILGQLDIPPGELLRARATVFDEETKKQWSELVSEAREVIPQTSKRLRAKLLAKLRTLLGKQRAVITRYSKLFHGSQ